MANSNLIKNENDFLGFDDATLALHDAVQPDPDQVVKLADQRAETFNVGNR